MSEVTSSQDELSEVDNLYRRLSASDPGRPGEWVRRKVQAYAAQQAAERAVRESAKAREVTPPTPAPAAVAPAPKPAAPSPLIEPKQTSSRSWLIPVVAGGVIMAGLIAYFAVPHGAPTSDTTAVPPPAPAVTPESPASQAEPEPAQVAQAPSASEPAPSPPAAQAPEPEPPSPAPPVAQQTAPSASAPPVMPHSSASAPTEHTQSPGAQSPAEHTQAPAAQSPAKPRVAHQNTPASQSAPVAQSSPPVSARAEPVAPPPPVANSPAPTSAPAPAPETRQAAVAPMPSSSAPAAPAAQPAPTSTPATTAALVTPPEDFYRAAESGDLAKLKEVLETNVNVNALDSKGHTALILAIQRGRTDTVKLLLAHGANPNQPDAHGASPMTAAYARGDFQITHALQRSLKK